MEIVVSIRGMTCEKCVAKVKQAHRDVEGVIAAMVQLEDEGTEILFKEGSAERHKKQSSGS